MVYAYTRLNTSIRTCSAIHHGWLCVPCETADDEGVVFFFPYRTAIRSGLTYSVYYTGLIAYLPAVLDHTPCMVGFSLSY